MIELSHGAYFTCHHVLCMCRASEALSSERTAFEAEKREHHQLYERQQQVS